MDEWMTEQAVGTRAATILWSSVRTVRRLSLLWRSGCGGRLSRQPTRGQARAVKGAPIRHLKWLKCR